MKRKAGDTVVFPQLFEVEVLTPSAVVEVDRFGNERRTPATWVKVKVFGWAVAAVDETAGDSVLRTVDQLQLYCSRDVAPDADMQVRLPDQSVWTVQGHFEDYENNPWWSPGLVVVRCRNVEG